MRSHGPGPEVEETKEVAPGQIAATQDCSSNHYAVLTSERNAIAGAAADHAERASQQQVPLPRPGKEGAARDGLDGSSYNGSMFEDEEDNDSSLGKSESPPPSNPRSVGQNKANGQIGDIAKRGSVPQLVGSKS